MAWTTPKTDFAPGNVLTAAQMNAIGNNLAEFSPLFAAFTSWTPRIDQGANTNIAKSATDAKYVKVGRLVIANCAITMSGAGVAGSAVLLKGVSLPAAAASNVFGNGLLFDASTTTYYNVTAQMNGSDLQFVSDIATNQAWGVNPNVAIASGDTFRLSFIYEASA